MLQAGTLPPFHPSSETRIQDGLDASARFPLPSRKRHDGVPSATVEVVGLLDDGQRLQAFQDWVAHDLDLAFRVPPAKLQSRELSLFMSGNSTDPAATMKALVLETRGWYEAPQQMEAERAATAHRALGF